MFQVTGNKVTDITAQQTAGWGIIWFLIHYFAGNSLHLVKSTIANNASFLDMAFVYPYRNSIAENQNTIFEKHIQTFTYYMNSIKKVFLYFFFLFIHWINIFKFQMFYHKI